MASGIGWHLAASAGTRPSWEQSGSFVLLSRVRKYPLPASQGSLEAGRGVKQRTEIVEHLDSSQGSQRVLELKAGVSPK